jgi:hypothetical protein
MSAPRGSIIVGKVHAKESQFILSQGELLMFDEKNNSWKRVVAPFAGVTKPGTRRFVIVVRDMVFTTFHPTRKKSVEKIERETVFNPPEISDPMERGKKCLSA